MNTPEKIYVYIPDDDIVGTASTQKGFPHQFVTEEYIRIDAFIEKAYSFVKGKLNDYIIIDIDNKYEGIDGLFFEDFKNYMKGE